MIVVGRHVAVLESVDVGHDLCLDEPTDGVADHQLLFGPFEHGAPPVARLTDVRDRMVVFRG